MKSITYFFRHPHAIYFSIEKLFHGVAGEMARMPGQLFFVKELNLPFTSHLNTIRKNIAFTKKSQSDINHITGDAHYAILGCDRKNINILTIHDCVLLYRYPKSNPRRWMIYWLWYKLPVKRADAITVISENTKKDLQFFTGCAAEKIHVISNYIDPAYKAIEKEFNNTLPRLLFIGTAPNKNLERTIEAIEGLTVQLTIVGYLNDEQVSMLKQRKINYTLLNKLSDAAMQEQYMLADLMLFPSVHEGFGLPIIEAQATGRPVLTSKLEPMCSVAGDAACFVDPYNITSIRNGIEKIIGDASYRSELVHRGFENVKRFQLRQVAQQYAGLYQKLVKEKMN